ncbi:hypothetical protein BDBG_16065 [Blastomyces gilchristii SLH14081]|uniref:Uncharacterized protein n=1 Tax=Blastomyces gilchristii (strain SLH14081) TaxID=559298 RepID=A0A179U634_BLAGS|nr:uncharacterized protein BDBG_16065 [Blastomyces gilchristii SLH14081]OAT03464.1 hypothetical protein BDBG_16065 [Blastomyces gilchristii SLH14081]
MHCDEVVLPRHITKPGPSKAPQRPSPELRAKEMENEASTAQTNHWFGRRKTQSLLEVPSISYC